MALAAAPKAEFAGTGGGGGGGWGGRSSSPVPSSFLFGHSLE